MTPSPADMNWLPFVIESSQDGDVLLGTLSRTSIPVSVMNQSMQYSLSLVLTEHAIFLPKLTRPQFIQQVNTRQPVLAAQMA